MRFRSACIASLATVLLVPSACMSSAGRDLSLTVRVANKTFKTGEPIPLELVVRYVGQDPLTLNFSTSQRYDFQIENEAGEVLWRWSDGRMFAQVVGQFDLSPELPGVRYRALFQGRLPPGRYTVRGFLMTRPKPLSALTDITIE